MDNGGRARAGLPYLPSSSPPSTFPVRTLTSRPSAPSRLPVYRPLAVNYSPVSGSLLPKPKSIAVPRVPLRAAVSRPALRANKYARFIHNKRHVR